MEKTLREELEEQFDIARAEGMLHSKDGKHSLSSEVDAEGIIEFISVRIKAKALTELDMATTINEKSALLDSPENAVKLLFAVAQAQLAAVLKELE